MKTIARKLMPTPKPITRPGLLFVRGHPRSGTNWVGMLLNLHPNVCCTGEFHLEPIYHAVEQSKTYPWQLMSRDPVKSEIDDAFQDMLRRCIDVGCRARRPEARLAWIGDRTPRDLLYWVPDASYIWILRDGRDVMVSWTFHQLRMGPEVIAKSVPPGPAESLIEVSREFQKDPDMFKQNPERLLACEEWVRRTAHTWHHRFLGDSGAASFMSRPEIGAKLFTVRYEDLRADTHRLRDEMYRFLDLDPEVAGPLSRESGTAAGFGRERATDFRRKGEVGDWRNYFTDDAKRWFNEIAGQSLVDAGYAEDLNW